MSKEFPEKFFCT
jgi:hypothetical protein